MSERDWNASPKLLTFFGIALIALGGSVAFGWYADNPALVQVYANFVPMQFNTAVGFLLCGAGLLFLTYHFPQSSQGVGAVTFCLSGLTLLEYVFNADFGIDQLLMEHYITVETSHPGRMAPNTALCFSLAGIAVIAMSDRDRWPKGIPYGGVLGAIIFSLGLVAIFGYAIDLEAAYGWGHLTRMALHTAGGFVVSALGIIAFAWKNDPRKILSAPPWTPILAGLVILTMTFCLWVALRPDYSSFLPTAVLVFGLLMATLLMAAIYFLQRERSLVSQLEKEMNERQQAEQELLTSREMLRNLSRRLQSVREEENTKVARDVHDELGQVLTALKMDLSCLKDECVSPSPTFCERTQSMGNLIDTTVQAVQRICLELRPQILDIFGLPEAIEWHANEFYQRTGIECDLQIRHTGPTLDPERAMTLFRVFQELLTNVARHAQARKVQIRLDQRNSTLVLQVEDDGKGISAQEISNPQSLGLLGIRERVLHWGGEVSIHGHPGEGSVVSITIPDLKP